jgi:CubicO group peptidase (beta-lactamase class C family)
MKPRKHLLTTLSVLLIAVLLVACGSPAAAPAAPPAQPTASPTMVPPPATLAPTVSVVPTATVQTPPVTPAAPGLEEQPSDVLSGFVENDGVRIHYEVQGEGPPLVLMHWLTGSLEDWRVFGYVDALKESYRLILIDARGHGQSDKPHDPAAYVLEKQAGDIVAVLDKLGVDKAHYYGYSLGGELGWALAKYVPDRFSSLMIGGASPEDFDPSAEIARDRGLGTEEYGNMAAGVLSGYGFSRPKIYAIYAATDFEAVIADLQAISTPNFAADLPGMTMPVLLLAGTGDEDYRAMEAATSKLPNATFASLPGNDHMTAYLRTNLLVEHLTKFLASVEKAGLDATTVAKIEALVAKTMQENKVPGYAMCVVKDGSEVYSKGFGVAELGGDQPVTPQSVFAIRSTTKSFTAVALMQLVEQGKVDLDKPVTVYLPYFKMTDPRYKDITVRMLASHTSGFTDEAVTATLPHNEQPTEVDAAIEWYVRSLSDDTLTAAPSETWQYADTNFILLGDIIGKVSGEPYNVYMNKHILEPLMMTHSTFDAASIPSGALVGEHVTTPEGVVETTPLSDNSSFESPAAGIYSTCEDMTRWMQVHLNWGELDGVRILKPESYDILWKVEAQTGLDKFFGTWAGQWGLGWSIGEDSGHSLAGHPGGGEGQNIHFQLAPDDNLGVVVLTNWGTETIAFPAWVSAADVTYALLGIDE